MSSNNTPSKVPSTAYAAMTPGLPDDAVPAPYLAIEIKKVTPHTNAPSRTQAEPDDYWCESYLPFVEHLFQWRPASRGNCAWIGVSLGIVVFLPLALAADIVWMALRLASVFTGIWFIYLLCCREKKSAT